MQLFKALVLVAGIWGIVGAEAGDANWRNWPARTLEDSKKTGESLFIYLKDGASKNNATKATIKVVESGTILDHGDVQKMLPAMMGSKMNLTDKVAASHPADWIERAKKSGVLIIVASSDLVKTALFDGDNKNPQSIAAACAMVQKYQNERKAEAAEKQKKEEAARKEKFAAEVKKNKMDAIPGTNATPAPKEKKPVKDGKEPVDE